MLAGCDSCTYRQLTSCVKKINRTCSDPNDIIETDHYIITYPEVGTSAGWPHVITSFPGSPPVQRRRTVCCRHAGGEPENEATHVMHRIMWVILSPAQLPHVTLTSAWVRKLGGHTHCAQHLITAWSAGPTRPEYHTGENEGVETGREKHNRRLWPTTAVTHKTLTKSHVWEWHACATLVLLIVPTNPHNISTIVSH